MSDVLPAARVSRLNALLGKPRDVMFQEYEPAAQQQFDWFIRDLRCIEGSLLFPGVLFLQLILGKQIQHFLQQLNDAKPTDQLCSDQIVQFFEVTFLFFPLVVI